MSILYLHLRWFFFVFIIFLFFFCLSLYVTSTSSIYLSFPLFSIGNIDLNFSVLLDFYSCWFRSVILLISSIIIVYSYFYIYPYSKSHLFLSLTLMFVFSMLVVVLVSDLFFLMLGWDGLGLISFFLIVYYQNTMSNYSGMFTLLINRIGDCFFLSSIVLVFYGSSHLFPFSSTTTTLFTSMFLIITFMTKRAIFPFSPWLPMAIAAPTPISALVHSSTLVTAGLYLMIRYSYFLYSHVLLLQALLILSIFTSFYAGLNAIFEVDLKKLIALSTLSHLGFIGLSFSLGLINLSFFHMLVHALFKSLLFMRMGDIITNLFHSQDVRFLSSGMSVTPFSCQIMYVSLLNLLGLPRLSGFFSKDLVLETLNFSSVSVFFMVVMFINVFFTYFYTYQLFYYSFSPVKFTPYIVVHVPLLMHSLLLTILGVFSIFFGYFYLSNICYYVVFPPIPLANKLIPLLLNFCVFSFLLVNEKFPVLENSKIFYYFSTMMYLFPFMSTFTSRFYYAQRFKFVKTIEYGALNSIINSSLFDVYFTVSKKTILLAIKHPFSLIYLVLFILFPLIALSCSYIIIIISDFQSLDPPLR